MRLLSLVCFCTLLFACQPEADGPLRLEPDAHISFVGGNFCARDLLYHHLETAIYAAHPDHRLTIRNTCDAGDTPGFRPHSGRNAPWAFPGAAAYQTEYASPSGSEGHVQTPDEWLTRLQTDVVIAFFGQAESFSGGEGLIRFQEELDSFIHHTQRQRYNGETAPRLVLVGPPAFQDLSAEQDLPDGKQANMDLRFYNEAVADAAAANDLLFIDLYQASKDWMSKETLTTDGLQWTEAGYAKVADYLSQQLFGSSYSPTANTALRDAVAEKNWTWHNLFKIPNGVHVFGRRFEPFGVDNYPSELQKLDQMTANRDAAIWAAQAGDSYDLVAADARTQPLPVIETNFKPDTEPRYLYGEEALQSFTLADDFQIELFASEETFPDLANPVQLSFDNRGRLWVAVMPSYPHYEPGSERPDDKLLILEDTDGDNRADKQTVFADGLHLPIGFELAPEGVYISQGTHLKLLTDTDGDDRADREEVLLSGFDDHDTHHAISAFTADPSGALYMAEGVFLHTNVETPYGPVRATNGGFYRYNPARRHLERTAQLDIPNPWGIMFDQWAQPFYAETSNPDFHWMLPGTIKSFYGEGNPMSPSLIEEDHRVRPTSGLEMVHSRHWPEAQQGDFLINNTIGFLGTQQHTLEESGTGYTSRHRQALLRSSDPNFRPVDMEFAPDGSLYIVDWHNVLVGHMQHNARDPLRDHSHGRVYRVTHKTNPLVEPAEVAGAPIATLLDNLKLPEYRTRYRTRRELRGRDAAAVNSALADWLAQLNTDDPNYTRHLAEALYVNWGSNHLNEALLDKALTHPDHRLRAIGVRVLRYLGHQTPRHTELLRAAAADPHGRVRMEAIAAASYLQDRQAGNAILAEAAQQPLDDWMAKPYAAAKAHLNGQSATLVDTSAVQRRLRGGDLAAYDWGKEIYHQEGYCATCHQPDGRGIAVNDYPPLIGTEYVKDEEKLIKITLHGLYGPMKVLGKQYPGSTPMTPYGKMLDDTQMAAVLTYVRNSFGNELPVVKPATVKRIRAETADREGFYKVEEL